MAHKISPENEFESSNSAMIHDCFSDGMDFFLYETNEPSINFIPFDR